MQTPSLPTLLTLAGALVATAGCSSTPSTLESRSTLHPRVPQSMTDDYYGPRQDDGVLTISGIGINNNDFDAGAASLTGSYSRFLTDDWEVGIRQSASFADSEGTDSVWNGSTRIAADYHFLDGNFQPMLGANFGWVYGDTVNETLAAAPEAGFKYFLFDRVFLQLLAEYQFFFEEADNADDAFQDGQFVYSLGFGVLLR